MAKKEKQLRGRARRETNIAYVKLVNELRIPGAVPPEIRSHITGYACAPELHFDSSKGELRAKWFPSLAMKTRLGPILGDGIPSWYSSKHLVIELPDFLPHPLSVDDPRWPSAIHIHDTTYELSFWCAPPFLSRPPWSISSQRHLHLDDFEKCPFWLFSRITIRIPPSTSDPASVIMNWSRFKYICYALNKAGKTMKAKRGPLKYHGVKIRETALPAIRVQFLEQDSKSWLDSRGELATSLLVQGQFLNDGFGDQIPDFVLLLRALALLRGAKGISIDIPFRLPASEEERDISIKWISNIQAQKYHYSGYMELGGWTDLKSFDWLQRCELVLHQTLHRLDSKLAPYLRLEQFLFIDWHAYLQLAWHAFRYNHQLNKMAHDYLWAIRDCGLSTIPPNLRCRCLTIPPHRGNARNTVSSMERIMRRVFFHGSNRRLQRSLRLVMKQWYSWQESTYNWKKEFQQVYERMEATGTPGEMKLSNPLQDFRWDQRFEDQLSTDCTEEQLFHNYCILSGKPFRHEHPFSPSFRMQTEAWLAEWPEGIIHTVSTIQAANEAHHCSESRHRQIPISQYFCLDAQNITMDMIG